MLDDAAVRGFQQSWFILWAHHNEGHSMMEHSKGSLVLELPI